VAAGFAGAMVKGDLSFCTYRGHAHTLARAGTTEPSAWACSCSTVRGLPARARQESCRLERSYGDPIGGTASVRPI
jgi:TPP-dependent pyruvate/acetoin dehydrogenase alpha subunit